MCDIRRSAMREKIFFFRPKLRNSNQNLTWDKFTILDPGILFVSLNEYLGDSIQQTVVDKFLSKKIFTYLQLKSIYNKKK